MSLQLFLLVGLAVALTGFAVALRAAYVAIAALSERCAATEGCLQAFDTAAKEVEEQSTYLTKQLVSLTARLARLEKQHQKRSYRDAIDLSQRGADVHEIESRCGVNVGEARLIKTLHGRADELQSAETA